MRPTRRWLFLFALAGIPAAFGASGAYATLALDFILVLLLFRDGRTIPVISDLEFRRCFYDEGHLDGQDEADDGQELTIRLRLGGLARGRFTLLERLPAGGLKRFSGALNGVSDAEFTYEITVVRGIRYEWDDIYLHWVSAWGLALGHLELHHPSKLYVRPPGLSPRQVGEQPAGFRGQGQLVGRRPGPSRRFLSLRDMVYGDAIHAVDWKASARRGKMVVRQYAEPRRLPTCAVLDLGVNMGRRLGEESLLDHSIAGLWQLAQRVVALNESMRLYTVSRKESRSTRAGRGMESLREIRKRLTRLEVTQSGVGLLRCLKALKLPRDQRFLVVIFTEMTPSLVDEPVLRQLKALSHGHQVLVVENADDVAENRAIADEEAKVSLAQNRLAKTHDDFSNPALLEEEVDHIRRGLARVGIDYLRLSHRHISAAILQRHSILYQRNLR